MIDIYCDVLFPAVCLILLQFDLNVCIQVFISLHPARNRFYKNVSVAGSAGTYEVNLDHRKLKTPLGNVLQVGYSHKL